MRGQLTYGNTFSLPVMPGINCGQYTVSGVVFDTGNNTAMSGVNFIKKQIIIGAITNRYGKSNLRKTLDKSKF